MANLIRNPHKFKRLEQFETEKTVNLPFKVEVAWQGFKTYIPQLENLLNRKLFYLEKLQERDPFQLTDKQITTIKNLQNEVQTLYNVFVAMSHLRETVAFELERKISAYESKIAFLEANWRGASDAMLLFKDCLTHKNIEK